MERSTSCPNLFLSCDSFPPFTTSCWVDKFAQPLLDFWGTETITLNNKGEEKPLDPWFQVSMSSDMGISPSWVRLLSCLFLSWLLRNQDPMFHGSFLYRLRTIVRMSLGIAAAASKCEHLDKGTLFTYLPSVASCRLGNRRWHLTDG